MNDLELFLLVLFALYLSECFNLIPRDAVALVAPFGGRWRAVFPSSMLGSEKTGAVLGNPVPPLGRMVFCQQWPFSVSPDSVYAYAALTLNPDGRMERAGKAWPFPAIRRVTSSEKHVRVNGEQLVRAATAPQAAAWANLLGSLSGLPQADRAAAIDRALDSSFDADAVSARVREWLERERFLRLLCNGLFLYLVVLLPVVAFTAGLWLTWPWLLLVLIAFMAAISVVFSRAHRVLYPGARGEKLYALCLIGVVPTIAIRACDYLSRHLLTGRHPLAAARALCTDADFRALARRAVLDARHPILPVCPAGDEVARSAESWFRERYTAAMERFLTGCGVAIEELIAPPVPRDETSRAYCPRCESEFTGTGGVCGACGGIPVQAFK